MQILAMVQGSALSDQSKLQLDTSVGMYLDRYLEVQSTQGGVMKYTRGYPYIWSPASPDSGLG